MHGASSRFHGLNLCRVTIYPSGISQNNRDMRLAAKVYLKGVIMKEKPIRQASHCFLGAPSRKALAFLMDDHPMDTLRFAL